MTLSEFWPQCLALLAAELPETQYHKFIAPLTVGESNGAWFVYAPTQFSANLLRSQHATRLEQARQLLAPNAPALQIKVGKGTHYEAATLPNITPNNSEKTTEKTSQKAVEENVEKTQKLPEKQLENPVEAAKENTVTPFAPSKKAGLDIIAKNLQNPRHLTENSLANPANEYDTSSNISRQKEKEQVEARFAQTNLNPEFTFNNFVEGKSNRLALLTAETIAETPGEIQYNPLFIYGNPGLGKTHLAQATANQLLASQPNKRVYYITSAEYVRTFANHARAKNWEAFTHRYQAYDLLIIDDVQYLAGKEGSMEEFFKLFEHFHSRNQQLILTCDQLPSNLDKMDQRLISRFNGGMTVRIEPPEQETRMLILMRKAEIAQVQLLEDAAYFIAQHVKTSVRELEGALKRVIAAARFLNEPITKDLAATILEDIVIQNYKPITTDWIILEVAKFYKISTAELLSTKRNQTYVVPRHMAMTLIKELMPKMSLPAIASVFGKKDHTTVLNAVNKITQKRNNDPETNMAYEKLRDIFCVATD